MFPLLLVHPNFLPKESKVHVVCAGFCFFFLVVERENWLRWAVTIITSAVRHWTCILRSRRETHTEVEITSDIYTFHFSALLLQQRLIALLFRHFWYIKKKKGGQGMLLELRPKWFFFLVSHSTKVEFVSTPGLSTLCSTRLWISVLWTSAGTLWP